MVVARESATILVSSRLSGPERVTPPSASSRRRSIDDVVRQRALLSARAVAQRTAPTRVRQPAPGRGLLVAPEGAPAAAPSALLRQGPQAPHLVPPSATLSRETPSLARGADGARGSAQEERRSRHPGESRDPGATGTERAALDTGFRRYDGACCWAESGKRAAPLSEGPAATPSPRRCPARPRSSCRPRGSPRRYAGSRR